MEPIMRDRCDRNGHTKRARKRGFHGDAQALGRNGEGRDKGPAEVPAVPSCPTHDTRLGRLADTMDLWAPASGWTPLRRSGTPMIQ